MSNENRLNKFIQEIKFPLISILLSFIIGGVFIIAIGKNPIVAYGALIDGSFGGLREFTDAIGRSVPYIFTSLAVAFAFRTGLFNIGAEGQYVMGTLGTIAAAYMFRGLPGFLLVPLVLIAGGLSGALWAFIPGILKAKRGVHEVIVTIMLNYTAIYLTNYFVRYHLSPKIIFGEGASDRSISLIEKARLTEITDVMPGLGSSALHTGIFVAILCSVIAYIILFKTTLGYELRSVGNNPYASEYGGISISKNIVLSMTISGVFAGLAGATVVAGNTYQISAEASSPGYGFSGIAVALVGKNHPIGVVAAAFLFGILDNGALSMQMEGVPREVVGIIQGIIIVFIAGEQAVKFISRWMNKDKKVKEA